MGLTFATPNGGNSAMTGNRNKNNNASANKQTSNYSGGGGHPSAGGYGGGTKTKTKTKTTTPNTPPPGRSTTPNTPPPGTGGDGGAAKLAAAAKATADAKAINDATKAREAQTRKAAADKIAAAKLVKEKAEAKATADAKAINDATKAREAQTRKAAEKVRLKAQADKLLAEKATKAKSVADENAAIEAESQRLLAESEALTAATAKIAAQKEQDQLNLTALNRYQEMTETPEVKGNPNVAGNTYANAPTQFTEGRSGTSFYPDQAPDTMFRGLGIGSLVGKAMGAITGDDASGKAPDVAEEPQTFVGGLTDAYSQFDPIGDFAQQTVYGMNDAAKEEYLRQEASNADWQGMSEADRVSLARKPQMDNQLAHAYIAGPNGTQNEAQLDALRPEHMSDEQWGKLPKAMKMQVADHSLGPVPYSAGETDGVVEEEVDNSPWIRTLVGSRPEFSFAGRSGMSSFAEGGEVQPAGIGGLFEASNRPAPMDPVLEHHYKNLAQGKAVQNEDGTVSTVYTAQVDIDGVPTLIPTVWDGQILSEDAATQRAVESGKAWPTAPTHEELRQYDIKLHEKMEPMPAEAAKMLLMGGADSAQYAEGGMVQPVQYMQQGGMASPYADSMRQQVATPMSQGVQGQNTMQQRSAMQQQGVGGLFQDMNRNMGMQHAQMGGAPLQVYSEYLNNTYTSPQAEAAQAQVAEFVDMVDQAERAHFGSEESFGYGGGSWQKGLMDQFQQSLPDTQANGIGGLSQQASSFKQASVPENPIEQHYSTMSATY